MNIQSHKDLIVWQKAMDLVVVVYRLTDTFPQSEQYGLTAQMRRAAVSIVSNIAEGRRRHSQQDFRHFLFFSFGSGAELETQLEVAQRLNYGKAEDHLEAKQLLDQVMRMLNKMTASLKV